VEWMFSRPACLELTHNWGTEDDPSYKAHSGNEEPKGYGESFHCMTPSLQPQWSSKRPRPCTVHALTSTNSSPPHAYGAM
jgi:hypothetical protein